MYFLFVKRKFNFKDLIKNPLVWIIRLFTQSSFHHVASTVIKDKGLFVSEAKYPYYRHIAIDDWMKENKGSKIYAFQVIKPYSPIIQRDFEREMLGRKYDTKGAIYSEVHKVPVLRHIFKQDPNDEKQFCSESVVELCVRHKFIGEIRNENFFSPQEFLELILDLGIVRTKPEIWYNKNNKNFYG